jgi:benzylsuccinate CoA-transferase BbsF subunit
MLDFQLQGKKAERCGNAKPHTLLHSVYRCDGDERWIAIEVTTVDQWDQLVKVLASKHPLPALLMGHEPWSRHSKDALDSAVNEASSKFDAFQLMNDLLAAGVPSGVALNASDLLANPMLEDRKHFWELHHPEMGTLKYNGPAYRFSETPAHLSRGAPCLGQDSAQVLTEFLGMSSETIARLQNEGALG